VLKFGTQVLYQYIKKMTDTLPDSSVWPLWRKIAFRFAFIYILLYITPWSMVAGALPWLQLNVVTGFYDDGWGWLVRFANAHWFHVADELVPFNGSGDTSFGYAQLMLMLILATVGCAIWSVADNKRNNYERIDYWFRVTVRYYLAYFCFVYGIIKIYSLQMIFPNNSQLASSLGDFLPMRFSWLFIGYSTPYQVFSGVMETIAGLLLLNRKTVTLGLVTATGVFIHVFVLNMAYDIPVKLFSGHLLLFSIYLLTYETRRLTDFFVFNRVADPDRSFEVIFTERWMQRVRIGAKVIFIVIAFVMPLFENYDRHHQVYDQPDSKPISSGLYDVDLVVLNNKDTIPALVSDSLRWKNIAFEKSGFGSIDAYEPGFFPRYGRRYFSIKRDTATDLLRFTSWRDTVQIYEMRYNLPDDNTVQLWSKRGNDSLFMLLKRSKKHFQLTERQFHWLSESNR
jgi:hypothetical protein